MRRLKLEDRIRLETLLKLPMSEMFGVMCISKKLPKIAELLNVSQSTIHREVKNRGFTYDNYDANKAHKHSIKKISLGNTHFIYSEEQKQLILSSIKTYSETKNWSPNALLLRFKIELPSTVKLPSLETIYQWVYEDGVSGGDTYKCLPRKHKKRKKNLNSRETASTTDKVSIHLRDTVANDRSRIGDIEIDSIVGPANSNGMLTGTDRKSRLTMATLVKNKSGDETLIKLLSMLLTYKQCIRTITSDNGTEFSQHWKIATELNTMYYFADPYSSYQRGTNEHANGMIRRYFPKGTDFNLVTEKELQSAIYKINNLPRKIHNGRTANEIHYGINKKLIPSKQRKSMIFAFRT